MKDSFLLKKFLTVLCVAIVTLLSVNQIFGWGFWAHKEINKRAIELLPPAMKKFFLAHAEYITEHAIDPDIRRSKGDSLEPYYHFLDIDYYGPYPFGALPRSYDSAVAKYSLETVRKKGVVPWRIAALTDSLSDALRRKDAQTILNFASDLGHYVADSHVPLHAVVDYDGVQHRLKGIHKRWESDLAERFSQSYAFPTEGAIIINDPLGYAFNTIMESYTYSDSVFRSDAEAQRRVAGAKTMKSVNSKGDTLYTYSDAYYDSMRVFDNGLVERRMRSAIVSLASYWYTAWVRAGKPELPTHKDK